MVSRISRLYGPKFNSDINSGLTNIATAFKPPSMQDVYLSQKLQSDAATQLRKQNAVARLSNGQGTLSDLFDAGVTDPIKGQNQLALNEAARTGDYSKMDPYVYAGSQNYGNTAAGHFTTKLSPGETFMAPASIASLYGMNNTQPSGAATETDSKGQPAGTGAFVYTAPEKSTDKLSTDAVSAEYLKAHPELIPGFVAAKNKGQTINIGGDNKIEDAYGVGIGDQLKTTLANAQKAPEVRNNINTMRSALASGEGNLTFGPGADTVQSAKKIFGSLTGQDLPGTAEADVINNLGFGLATAAVKDISSRPGQQEFVRALQVKPGLQMSKPGMLAALDLMEQNQKAHEDLAALASSTAPPTDPTKYKTAGQENRANWPQVVASYYQQNPLKSPFNPAKPLSAEDAAAFNASQGQTAAPAVAPAPIQVTPELLNADPKTLSTEQLQAVVNAKRQAAPTPAPPGTPGVDIGPTVVPVSPLDYMRGGG